MSEQYYREITGGLSAFPVSFDIGERHFSGFDPRFFTVEGSEKTVADGKERNIFTLRSPEKLKITLDTAFYPDYGAYEWTVWFENDGADDSPVISSLLAADMLFSGGSPLLRGILGDHENQYRPYEKRLDDGGADFKSYNGRPTHIWFPYFDLVHGDGGTLIALGWGGTWEARFFRDAGGVRLAASGTNGLHTYLKPGERIRTPLMAFLPYSGRDGADAANLWRRWYVNCCMPRRNAAGDRLEPFSTSCLSGDTGLPNSDGSISERSFTWRPSLEKMLAEKVHIDYRWFDAGWYTDPYGKTVESDWWGTVGTWELDPEKWPGDSFRESTDFARSHGMKTLVWFEPERVTHVDGLTANYGYKKEWGIVGRHSVANNIGDPDCLAWTLERITSMLGKNGVEMYREDNNSDPMQCWTSLDALEGENRSGITENKSVVGHYALWDGIIAFCAAHGGDTFVDSCASGGGRNDLESMRRGVPILRSDSDRTTTALRLSMTTAFNKWIPFCGALTTEQAGQLDPDGKRDKYIFRASYLPAFNISAQWVQDKNTDFDMIRFGIDEWSSVKDFLLQDFYTLTPWHAPDDKAGWTAYMFFDPKKDAGVLLAFRMEEAEDPSVTLSLRGLRPGGRYLLRDADLGELGEFSAEALGSYAISRGEPRSSALIYITGRGE